MNADANGQVSGAVAAKAETKTQAEAPNKSTRHFKVNRTRARTLAGMYADFDEVCIRETLEGFPVKGAINLLIWATAKAPNNPYKKLRDWARKNGKGHYSETLLKKPSAEVYGEYMAALEEERSRVESVTGRERLTREEIDRVTQEVYAPRSRAEYSRISEASWRSFHEELGRKDHAS